MKTDSAEVVTMSQRSLSILFPAAVRERILQQHCALREVLRRAIQATTSSFEAEGADLAQLAYLAHDLRVHLRAHLSYEELALAPVLAHVDLWGPERVQQLFEEHARQRAELDTLVEGIEDGWDVERLALTLRSLVTDLLIDMDEEERGCLSAQLLGDQMMMLGAERD
jgi:hypothetical protein